MKPTAGRDDLLALAERLVRFGRVCGADEIEVGVGDGTEFSVDVRLGEIENLVEAGSRSMGLRIIKDKKTAFASSSDLDEETLKRLIRNAVRRAELSSRDEFSGLPTLSKRGVDPAALSIYDPEIEQLDSKTKIGLALETERIALADKRITNSHGASFVTNDGTAVLASSNGFLGRFQKSYCSLSVGLQAGATDDMVEDFWFSSQTHFEALERPEQIARTAVERTVRQLRPRKIKTQKVPVIFEPMMTSGLLGFLFSCVAGTAIYQKSSFLVGKLGRRIANDAITVVDDGRMPGKLGTSPFDSEGVPSRRTVVVQKGILKNYLCNTYAARKLKLRSTGNADGGGVGPNNFYLEPGPHAPSDIIRSCEKGLVLIRTLGHGLNPVNGDISRGAFGLWIEKGEIAYPVSEITISGNLGELLKNIEMVGSDLEFRGSICGPTIKVAEMMVSGT
ncbi:MAG: TldD/PmbA family protein [Candidatus Aminicenantes bacterium]|nr:TldD/PmbA family protein [Candidatus Aminicenantes bacterium]